MALFFILPILLMHVGAFRFISVDWGGTNDYVRSEIATLKLCAAICNPALPSDKTCPFNP